MDYNRFLQLDGVFNFRDIGGLNTKDGCMIKPGLIFRSGELSQLSDNSLEGLKKLNIKLIIDLRTKNECKSKPDKIPDNSGIRVDNIPFCYNNKDMNNQEFFSLLLRKSKELDFEALIKNIYHDIAFGCTAQIKEVLTLISDKDNLPALIHCTGGKDRTGTISAIIQLITGVPEETVIEDYLASNGFIEQRMKKTLKFIRWMSLFRISPERIKPMLIVRRDYLEDVLIEIIKQYSTIENYLDKLCSIEKESVIKLKQILLGQN